MGKEWGGGGEDENEVAKTEGTRLQSSSFVHARNTRRGWGLLWVILLHMDCYLAQMFQCLLIGKNSSHPQHGIRAHRLITKANTLPNVSTSLKPYTHKCCGLP